jgi:hypothetical protein
MVDRLLRQDETLEQLRADFMARVQVATSGCWLWDGDAERYGNFRGVPAHRVSWELHQGPIGEGLYILHGCDIGGAERAAYGCVNPSHIRPGTPKENAQDFARSTSSKLRRGGRGVRVDGYLPTELERELRLFCARERRSVSDTLTEAVSMLLQRHGAETREETDR